MVRGEIYLFDPAPRSGSELKGRRPCIVVSQDVFSASDRWHSVTVVPMTSSERWVKPTPSMVLFEAGECGFSRPCAAMTQQITTVDKAKLTGPPIGRLGPEKLAELAEALRNYLDL